jgi:hypothetical protein
MLQSNELKIVRVVMQRIGKIQNDVGLNKFVLFVFFKRSNFYYSNRLRLGETFETNHKVWNRSYFLHKDVFQGNSVSLLDTNIELPLGKRIQ